MKQGAGWIAVKENRDAWRALLRQILALKSEKPAGLFVLRGKVGSGKSRLVEEGLSRLLVDCPGATFRVLEPADLDWALKSPQSEWYQGKELAQLDWLILENWEPMTPSKEDRLCRLLDERRNQGLPVLLTTRQPWTDLAQTARLSNRLRGGLCLQLEPWSLASRRKWLEKLLLSSGLTARANMIRAWCQETEPWPGPMEKRAHAFLERLRQPKPSTRQGMKKQVTKEPGPGSQEPKNQQVYLNAISKSFGVSTKQIEGKSRDKKIVLARCAVVGLLRERQGSSLQAIGAVLGHRNHSTILNAWERYRKLKRSSPGFVELLKSAQELI